MRRRETWSTDTCDAIGAELAVALGISAVLASSLLDYSRAMRIRLPQLGAALLAGDISYAMFQTIVYRTNLITDTDALAAVDAELAAKVRRWPSLTRGRLAAYVDMKVKVTQPVQVVWDGTRYTKGDTPDVPDDVGRQWIRQGWATETKAAAPRKRSG